MVPSQKTTRLNKQRNAVLQSTIMVIKRGRFDAVNTKCMAESAHLEGAKLSSGRGNPMATHHLKRWKVLFLTTSLGKKLTFLPRSCQLSFLPKWSCQEENLLSFHVYRSNWEIPRRPTLHTTHCKVNRSWQFPYSYLKQTSPVTSMFGCQSRVWHSTRGGYIVEITKQSQYTTLHSNTGNSAAFLNDSHMPH